MLIPQRILLKVMDTDCNRDETKSAPSFNTDRNHYVLLNNTNQTHQIDGLTPGIVGDLVVEESVKGGLGEE